jgi:hypothetical protein
MSTRYGGREDEYQVRGKAKSTRLEGGSRSTRYRGREYEYQVRGKE